MSENIEVNKIDPLSERDKSIFLDCEIDDGNSVPLNDVSVVVSVYDTTENFIEQHIINGKNFRFDYSNENDLLNYIETELLNLDERDDLNKGIYRLRFSFILDTFNSVNNDDYRFIVTEISPDGTEVRLSPLSNEEEFIDTFSRIKDYEKSDKRIDINETGFSSFYRMYVNSVFSDENLRSLFVGQGANNVTVDGVSLVDYLTEIYKKNSSSDDNQVKSAAKYKAEQKISEMVLGLKGKKAGAINTLSSYFQENKDDLFEKLRNTKDSNNQERRTILNEFKINIKNELQSFMEDAVDEVIRFVLTK